MPRSRSLVALMIALLVGAAIERASAQPAKIPNTLEQRVLACAICHGKQGEGLRKNEYYPRLAGKPAEYLYNQLLAFSDKRRESPIMTYMVGYLSEPYLREIAEYYSKLRPPFPQPATRAPASVLARGESLATKGDEAKDIPACTACHGKALTGLEPAIPGLVGLLPDYIAAQMGAWKEKQRHAQAPDCMAEIAGRLSPEDSRAVAAWLAAQRASPETPPEPAGSLKLPMECGSVPQK
jgi:cytochrome c553